MELNLLGINVSLIRPGAVKTNMLGESTSAIDNFINNTELYKETSTKFKKIVDSVETKNIPAEKIAKLAHKIVKARRPKYVYNINRNFLLKLLNILPDRLQVFVIGKLLKSKDND
jgi:short-subunit dehydrogenase